jgi:hypothetical protein
VIVLVTTEADKTGRKEGCGCFVCIDWGFFPVILLHLWRIWIAERLADFCFLFPAGKIKLYEKSADNFIPIVQDCLYHYLHYWFLGETKIVARRSKRREKDIGFIYSILVSSPHRGED